MKPNFQEGRFRELYEKTGLTVLGSKEENGTVKYWFEDSEGNEFTTTNFEALLNMDASLWEKK